MDFEGIEIHEAANLFPMEEESIHELAQDIKENGQHETIKLFDGKLIDGRRRWQACEKAGIDPRIENIDNEIDPIKYVISLNLHRRHLNTSQRAMVAARAREYYDEEAKKRMQATLKQNQDTAPVNSPERCKGDSRDIAGKAVGVGGSSVDCATKVLTHGVPELVKAVEEGKMAVSSAAVLATEPPEVQRDRVNEGKVKIGSSDNHKEVKRIVKDDARDYAREVDKTSKEFEAAYTRMAGAIRNAREEGWVSTTKTAALKRLESLNYLIH